MKKVQSALISVFHKTGLEKLVDYFKENETILYSTGGTQKFLEEQGLKVVAVEDITQFPEILGGRVKTLHPAVFGGILNRRDNEGDRQQIADNNIPDIDMVVVDLYPFEATVAAGGEEQEIIEKIDIGGISLIRAAAKNFKDVAIVPSQKHYSQVADWLNSQQGELSLENRKWLAAQAFQVSRDYDTAIAGWMEGETPLRYGENPHQPAKFRGDLSEVFTQLHGKELSYNNLLDVDAALNLSRDLNQLKSTHFAVLKHNNACGVALRDTTLNAWKDALAGDPVSAFGGVLITNGTVDEATALEIDQIFFEVILAADYTTEALEVLKRKKNRIILKINELPKVEINYRSAINGILVQDSDLKVETEADFKNVCNRAATTGEIKDLLLANILVKNTKSNAIVLVKNNQLLASGTGQTSRVDALKQAIAKAVSFKFDLQGSVMASDAFFPFPDCVEIAHNAGVNAVVQPGGSIKDNLSVDYCNSVEMAMVMTGTRHFKH